MPVKLDYLKLKERRNEIDITQKELSEKSGTNLNLIKAIETGRTISDKGNIAKLCDVLGIDINSVYKENFKQTKVISILNNKGGSGKTSMVGSLAYALTEPPFGNRCLIIDTDAQMNLTHSFGITSKDKNIYQAMINEESLLNNYIIHTDFPNIDIVVSDVAMSQIEMVLYTKIRREYIFEKILQPVIDKGIYDYIVIDTIPTLGMSNYNVVQASDYVIIPVILSSFGAEGVDLVVNYIKDISDVNHKTKLMGIVLNVYDKRKKSVNLKCESALCEWGYESLIFNTRISVDSHMESAQMNNVPLLAFDKSSRAAKDYASLAKEVLSKC